MKRAVLTILGISLIFAFLLIGMREALIFSFKAY